MVDFNTLMSRSSANANSNPLDIFEKLPKSKDISNLYHVQAEILEEWFDHLRNESDVVIELNTGGGKTLVGLLLALSTMRELKSGVVYLAENKQLVNQVVRQAASIGIPAKPYLGRNSVDASFANGETILVGSYQMLFNGNSVFGVRGARNSEHIAGIVIDDAHASLEAVKNAFSFSIPAEGSGGLYKKVLGVFKRSFDSLDRSSTYHELQDGIGNEVIGIPYSHWYDAMSQVSSWVKESAKTPNGICNEMRDALAFNWPLVKNNLKYCQVVVSRTAITISALYPLLDMVPSFRNAQRRIYMSATITDYGDMVRAYDVRNLTQGKIIAPKTSAGVGRRMILAIPHEIIGNDELQTTIEEELNRGHGVVRLTPRGGVDCNWCNIPFCSPVGHKSVTQAVEQLVSGSSTTALSLANRYNGIDLPDDACRILILEDLPLGANDIDVVTEEYLSQSDLISQRIAQRIEQGAGRGVRGASDHCVVLLVGFRLIDWIRRSSNRKYFSDAFRAQLKIGDTISENLNDASDYCEVMKQEFFSDEGWKAFHASELAQHISCEDARSLNASFAAACAERKAFAQWREHRYGAACQKLEAEAEGIVDDKQYKGWLLYLASCIAYDGGDIEHAGELSQKAHSFNLALPHVAPPSALDAAEKDCPQAESLCTFIATQSLKGDILSQFDIDTSDLSFDVLHSSFEEALKMLGCYLGFDSYRADKNGEGPDVCWISKEGIAFALEAKNEKGTETPFHKVEAGQLRTACSWLGEKYPDMEIVPVSVHPNAKADINTAASDLFVLLPEHLNELRIQTRNLLEIAINALPNERASVLSNALKEEGPTASTIKASHLRLFQLVE